MDCDLSLDVLNYKKEYPGGKNDAVLVLHEAMGFEVSTLILERRA